jgi:hypothetical protein
MAVAALLARAYQSGINRDCTSARAKLAEARAAIETLPLVEAETSELAIRIAEVEMFLSICCNSSLASALDSVLGFLHRGDVGLERKLSEVVLSLRELRRRLAQVEQ